MTDKKNIKYVFSRAVNTDGTRRKINILDVLHRELPNLKDLQLIHEPQRGANGPIDFLGDKYAIKSLRIDSPTSLSKFEEGYKFHKKIETIEIVPNLIHKSDKTHLYLMNKNNDITLDQTRGKRTLEQDTRIATTLAKYFNDVSTIVPAKDYSNLPLHDSYLKPAHYDPVDLFCFKSKVGKDRYTKYTEVVNAFEEIYTKSEPVIIHGDLNTQNIFVNPNDYGEITGIIDFDILEKRKIPEENTVLQNLDIELNSNITSLFNQAYHNYRTFTNGYDVLTTYKAATTIKHLMNIALKTPSILTEENLQKTDKQVAQCKLPTPT